MSALSTIGSANQYATYSTLSRTQNGIEQTKSILDTKQKAKESVSSSIGMDKLELSEEAKRLMRGL